jgi:hypothetical protein
MCYLLDVDDWLQQPRLVTTLMLNNPARGPALMCNTAPHAPALFFGDYHATVHVAG